MANIEVEIRGFLNKNKYKKLISFLDKHSRVKDIDHRETVFFIIPKKTLKVTKQISKNSAKIALKVGEIGRNIQEEYEVSIDPQDFDLMVNLFKKLGFTQVQYTLQKRNNYRYKNYEIAVKWSKDWGYHFEIEKVIQDPALAEETKRELNQFARKLGLKTMSEREFSEFAAKVDKSHRTRKDTGRALYIQARENNLGRIQQMDKETIEWIKLTSDFDSKRISFSKNIVLTKKDINLFKKYIPKKKYFYQAHLYSIHGLSHILRVMINTILICKLENIKYCQPYLFAASIHDIRRRDDRSDRGHGERAWIWLQKNIDAFNYPFLRSAEVLEIIKAALIYHEIDYPDIPRKISDQCRKAIDIIKAADALDRYRMPKEKWWPNPKLIKLKKAHSLISACEKFTIESESLILENNNPIDSVTESAKNIFHTCRS